MFQFTRFASLTYEFSQGFFGAIQSGFPHSGTSGSVPACGYPERFAADRALRRLPAPWHPPCALNNLTYSLCYPLCSFQGAFP
jgi:hypothetical protein